MYYTDIDLHKFNSYLTTIDSDGHIVKQAMSSSTTKSL